MMRIGVPRELKTDENRVALAPAGCAALRADGHDVLVETGAGVGSGFEDARYVAAGARIVDDPGELWGGVDLVMKVKEPIPAEYRWFRPHLLLFAYLHLAAEPQLTRALIEAGMTAVAYETVQTADGSLPLLMPMSEIAGRMATQVGARYLERPYGGAGILLGGVPGVPPGRVVVLGGGIVGANAARVAIGLGAAVTVVDINPGRLRALDDRFGGRVETVMSNEYHIARAVAVADLLIGAVLVPGARAPRLVTEAMVRAMRPGSVVVDVAVDQGGSIATVDRVTTHSDPVYVRDGVIHYAVANMPGAVPRTATAALTNATLPYARALAGQDLRTALSRDPALAAGLNLYRGEITLRAVAEAHRLPWRDATELLQCSEA